MPRNWWEVWEGPGTLRPRGDALQWSVTVCYRQFSRTLRGTRREIERAIRVEHARLLETTPRAPRSARTGTIAELVTAYEASELRELEPHTQRVYQQSLARFVRFAGTLSVTRLTLALVAEYDAARRDGRIPRADGDPAASVGARTRQKDLMTIRALSAWAVSVGRLAELPFSPTRKRRRKQDRPAAARGYLLLSAAQEAALLAECDRSDDRLGTYFLLLADTALRTDSEGLHVRVADFDLEGGFLLVTGAKTGEPREVPLSARLVSRLREHLRRYPALPGAYLFPHAHPAEGLCRASFRMSLMRAARAVGIPTGRPRTGGAPSWTPYHLRHRRITQWVVAGHIAQASKAAGHSRVETTTGTYTHLARENLRVLVEPTVQPRNARPRARAGSA